MLEQPVVSAPVQRLPSLLVRLLICTAAFAVYGLVVRLLGLETGTRSDVPPIYAWWKLHNCIHRPGLLIYLIPPILMFGFWRWFVARQSNRAMSTPLLLGVAVLFGFMFYIAVCLMDGGPSADKAKGSYPRVLYEIMRPFDYPGVEFSTDVHFVKSPRQFLHDYVNLHGWLALHCRTHPPGPVLFLWGVQQIFGRRLMPMSLAAIFVSAISIAPAFLIARRLYGQRVAIAVLGMCAVTPSIVLYGATCMDGVYALPLLLCVYLFVAGTQATHLASWWGLSLLLGAMMVVASMMTFSTSSLGVLFGIYALLAWWKSPNWRRVWGMLLIAAVAFVALYLLIYVGTGYNLIQCLKVSMASDSEKMGARVLSLRRYADVSFANLAAFLLGSGLIVTVLLFERIGDAWRQLRQLKICDLMLTSFVLAIVFLSGSTLYRWETERIWVFLTPLAVMAAANAINRQHEPSARTLKLSMIALFVQTYLMQVLMFTLW